MKVHSEATANLTRFDGDIDARFHLKCLESPAPVAWDIETSGLDWGIDAIGTCQLAADGELAIVQIHHGYRPERLVRVLETEQVRKVFHHAPFDLRFMAHKWKAEAANVACTKVASKILHPELDSPEHSLMAVLFRTLAVQISKDQRLSDWRAPELSQEQLHYAANDVRYLGALLDAQIEEARQRGLIDAIEASFAYLPTRVGLDLRGVGDVYAY